MDLLCHHAKFGLGSDIVCRQGAKKFDVLFVCLFFCFLFHALKNKVCERHFTMNALEYGNDFGMV